MDNMKQLNAATEKAVYVKPTMQMYEIEIEDALMASGTDNESGGDFDTDSRSG